MFNLHIIPVTAFQQNCSIIWDNQKNAAIIDAGGDVKKIIAFVESQQLKVKTLLITHGHLDHIMAVESLKKYFGVEVLGSHIADSPLFDALPTICESYGIPAVSAFRPDQWLSEGDIIEIGQLQFSVRHLPGHAPGHIGFFDFQNKIAFTGDVLFKKSIGRTDLYMGNFEQLLHTIQTKLFDLENDFIIIAGHGSHTTIGYEKQHNPFLR
ncbi:glyoxylase-like metal-dependent hydrolase (beta-lactamase superfamily II) [Nicoletella semolina]|uniref:Glyoxylase-like metal-dependent hydrolase (Beta-lactamase superfamily II) n=1 Tax=Nicoletella semolina TaxID=271160 RepID=A0A4R2NC84_9PAST|nr:MBL fold metallo-hydrolase [Nicoletella semolina]MDH2924311.1 MBL fold metallo-hydrolase [Nicoletella semolina]TCP18789.1 glyoxylase-like metal-dependent hydrolase (beta-lactamase superfamily II) [Nicoletella semolina]